MFVFVLNAPLKVGSFLCFASTGPLKVEHHIFFYIFVSRCPKVFVLVYGCPEVFVLFVFLSGCLEVFFSRGFVRQGKLGRRR